MTGTRIQVVLTEVPTDVLVHMAAHPTRQFTVHELAAALGPEGVHDAEGSVASALALLKDGDYVLRREGSWSVTPAGVSAVATAAPCDDDHRDAARPKKETP